MPIVIAILFISALLTGLVAVFCYQRRHVIGATVMMWLMIALTWWSLTSAVENLNPALNWHLFWSAAQYLGITTVPVFWLLFALQYSQQDAAPSVRSLLWLWIVPVITNLMVWTNPWHDLIWAKLELAELSGFTILTVEHGFYFWVHVIYSYICILAGIIIFIRQATRSDQAYRSQAGIMLIVVAVLLIGNILYLFGLLPSQGVDITPLSFSIAAGLLTIALFRHRMLDLMPVANEIILNNMGDGILVLDAQERVIYANQAFELLAGLSPGFMVGQDIRQLLDGWPAIFQRYDQRKVFEIEVEIDGFKRILELLVSPLLRQGVYAGGIYVIRDITDRLDLERRLRLSLEIKKKEHGGDYIFLVIEAVTGQVLDVNNEFVVETGFSREQAIGRTLLQIGLWDVEMRTNLTRLLRDHNQIVDTPLTVFNHAGRPQSWLLSVSLLNVGGKGLQMWAAKQKP